MRRNVSFLETLLGLGAFLLPSCAPHFTSGAPGAAGAPNDGSSPETGVAGRSGDDSGAVGPHGAAGNSDVPRFQVLTTGFGLSCGTAVSADGRVVVGYLADTPRSYIRPFRWSKAEGAVALASATESLDYGNALAISADGQVIAGYASLASQKGAFRWTPDTGIVLVGAGDGAGLSRNGATLAGRDSSQSDGMHFYRWTAATGAVDLGRLGAGAQVTALSGDGTTVVGWRSETAGSASHAFLWTSADGIVRLDSADANSSANAVSGDGGVVVGAHVAEPGSSDVAFRWDREHGLVDLDLGDLTTNSIVGSSATGVTSDGTTIVGTVAHDSWIWSPSSGARLISELLLENGADVAGFSDFEVAGVSDDGSVITGCVKDGTLATQAFIARLDE